MKSSRKTLITIAVTAIATIQIMGLFFPSRMIIYNNYDKPKYIKIEAEISAYSPREQETDSDPYINASNKEVAQGDIACPEWLEFETKVVVEGQIFICRDRMAKRYRDKNNFDILMFDHKEALAYGRQSKTVKIYDN